MEISCFSNGIDDEFVKMNKIAHGPIKKMFIGSLRRKRRVGQGVKKLLDLSSKVRATGSFQGNW